MKKVLPAALMCCLTAFADDLTLIKNSPPTTPVLAPKIIPSFAGTRTATATMAKQPGIKMETGVRPPLQVETNQPPTMERPPLKLEPRIHPSFWKTGTVDLSKGINVGFDLSPADPPFPRDSGGSALLRISFRLEKRWRQ